MEIYTLLETIKNIIESGRKIPFTESKRIVDEDEILDLLGEDTYQYFGFNGPVFYCYTVHDPKGPVFFQDPNNLQSEDTFFAKNLKKQMQETNVFIVSYVKCGVLTDYVNDYIKENFILIEKSDKKSLIQSVEKPKTFKYKIYIRKP